MLVSGFPQKSGFPLIEGLPPGFFLVRDVDSSIPNTGFISVPRSDSVVLICVIVLRTDCEVLYCSLRVQSMTSYAATDEALRCWSKNM